MDHIERNGHIINCACASISRDGIKRFFAADFHDIAMFNIPNAERQRVPGRGLAGILNAVLC